MHTSNGAETFHGTIIVIFQRENKDGQPLQQPLQFFKKFKGPLFSLDVSYLSEPQINLIPIRFSSLELESRAHLLSSDYSDVWFLSNYLYHALLNPSNTDNQSENVVESSTDECPILSVVEKNETAQKARDPTVLPTWSATRSLVISHSDSTNIQHSLV